MRTSVIQEYICPSATHESLVIGREMKNAFGHTHPPADESGNIFLASISDYMGVKSSSCAISRLTINIASTTDIANKADGAIVPVKPGNYVGVAGSPGSTNFPQKIGTYKNHVTIAKITDGTTKTLMFGEISKRRADGFQAFNGDNEASLFLGEARPFDEDPPRSGTDLDDVSFGSAHASVVMFAMCDGSVQAISKDISPMVLDRMAQRNDGEVYDISGTLPTCIAPTGPTPL
jgi:hypothetical protein